MKLLPFNITAIKNGAKCVVMPDVVSEFSENTGSSSEIYPVQFRVNGSLETFTSEGYNYKGETGIRLAILDETEKESPQESFYRLLNVGEEILVTDECFEELEGHKDWRSLKDSYVIGAMYEEAHLPIRRLVTITSSRCEDSEYKYREQGKYVATLEAQLKELTNSPVSPWVRYEDRKPTHQDADKKGQVLFSANDWVYSHHWDTTFQNKPPYWMPVPPLPKNKRNFQTEFVNKLEGEVKEMWNFISNDVKRAYQKHWEASDESH